MSEIVVTVFAQEWYRDWNAHDLDAVLEHYAEDVRFSSPFVVQLVGDPEGEMRGKHELRHYFARAFTRFPDLHFRPIATIPGVNSVVLVYESVNELVAAEYIQFNAQGKICNVSCHYTLSEQFNQGYRPEHFSQPETHGQRR